MQTRIELRSHNNGIFAYVNGKPGVEISRPDDFHHLLALEMGKLTGDASLEPLALDLIEIDCPEAKHGGAPQLICELDEIFSFSR